MASRIRGNYSRAVSSIDCPTCPAKKGVLCNTSSVVHKERRMEAIKLGLWDPDLAQVDDPDAPFYAEGDYLEAFKPAEGARGAGS